MTITPVGSNTVQGLASQLLQELNAGSTGTQTTGLSGLGDLMTLSPAAQQLAKAPDAVTQAMNDLLAGQKDVQADLATVRGYFQQNPKSLASVLSSLQGTSAATPDSNGALLTALMNKQSSTSDPQALLNFMGSQGQNNLFSALDATGGSTDNTFSLLG